MMTHEGREGTPFTPRTRYPHQGPLPHHLCGFVFLAQKKTDNRYVPTFDLTTRPLYTSFFYTFYPSSISSLQPALRERLCTLNCSKRPQSKVGHPSLTSPLLTENCRMPKKSSQPSSISIYGPYIAGGVAGGIAQGAVSSGGCSVQ